MCRLNKGSVPCSPALLRLEVPSVLCNTLTNGSRTGGQRSHGRWVWASSTRSDKLDLSLGSPGLGSIGVWTL